MTNNTPSYKRKRIYAKEEFCVGCRLCEVHCIVSHSQYRNDPVKAYKRSTRLPMPRIKVEEKRPVSFGLQCRHCDDPICVKSCITGAMHKDSESGIVSNKESRCIGCWTCVLVCPYGVIERDVAGKKVASKCDFCLDSGGDPACVKNCPNQALFIEDADESGNNKNTKGC